MSEIDEVKKDLEEVKKSLHRAKTILLDLVNRQDEEFIEDYEKEVKDLETLKNAIQDFYNKLLKKETKKSTSKKEV